MKTTSAALAIGVLAACSAPAPADKPGGTGSGGAGGGSGNPGAGGATGGVVGSGGAGGSAAGSTPGGGAAGTGAGGGTPVSCNITVTSSSPSTNIATVGIVEFTTDLAGASGGVIQFGPTTDYGLEAPIDLAAPNYRTLLLGMIQNTAYHYRIVLNSSGNVCMSPDQTIMTGYLPNGGPSDLTPQPGQSAAAPISNGFFVTSSGLEGWWIFVMNHEGKLVWAYDTGMGGGGFEGITRARLSWDGKHMYARDLNVTGEQGAGRLFKIPMDGSMMETIELDTSHHDFTVTSDNGVAYLAKEGASGDGSDPCDAIWKRSADGSSNVMVYDMWLALEDFDYESSLMELCHANAINYIEADDSFTVSDLYRDVVLKVSSSGTLVWALGGTAGGFSGNGTTWNLQHGHHLHAADQILIFVNGGNSGPSRALGFQLDTGAMTASENFNYEPGPDSPRLGDVQRLPNGNTLVTFSGIGQIHELDSAQQPIRTFSANSFGYTDYRTTLYGPPTRR